MINPLILMLNMAEEYLVCLRFGEISTLQKLLVLTDFLEFLPILSKVIEKAFHKNNSIFK